MRRTWFPVVALVMCLAVGGMPTLGREASEAPSAAVTGTGALISGTSECLGLTATVTPMAGFSVEHVEYSRCISSASDPRVSGTGGGDLYRACYPSSDPEQTACFTWGSQEIVGPEGSWLGSSIGVDEQGLGAGTIVTIYEGTEAYEGWSLVVHDLGSSSGATCAWRGVIYQGPPPPWHPSRPTTGG